MARSALVLLALLALPLLGGPEIRTGSRLWTLEDGSQQPLRLVGVGEDGGLAHFIHRDRPYSKRVEVLAKDDRALVEGLARGEWKLSQAPGLNVEADFTLSDKRPWDWLRGHRVGAERKWTRVDGQSLEARLLNLTDDRVTLLFGERIWRQPIDELSEADLAYLRAVKEGRERLHPGLVPLTGHIGFGGDTHSHVVCASGERLAAQPGPEGRFEVVLAAALNHVKECFDGAATLLQFEEVSSFYPDLGPPAGWRLAAPAASFEGHATLYRATFEAPNKHRREVSALWPDTTTPRDWPELEFQIYLLADARLASVNRVK